MERDYDDGVKSDVMFFTGTEVEHTPAYAMKTLFVVGVHDASLIKAHAEANGCYHIYLGANQSFDPGSWTAGDHADSTAWDKMIRDVLELNMLVTLDFDAKHIEWVCEGCYCENDMFIPQISVKLPYIRLLNYNATLKIDDKDYGATNPGVWCHSVHDLMDRKVFTPWTKYMKDKPL